MDGLFHGGMKLLAVADIHGSQYRLNIILDNIKRYTPDIVVVCGDITQFGPGEVARNFLDQIPVETFAVPGNIDSADVGRAICDSRAENIHCKRVVKNGIFFVGIGGVLPSSLSDLRIKDNKTSKSLVEVIYEKSILVTHEPPFKTQDTVFFGHHAGNRELREIVEQCTPRLVICGHIHEDPGVTCIGGTIVVNCSMGKRTEGALIEIEDEIKVKILD